MYIKGTKNIQWGNDGLLNKRWWENWTITYQRTRPLSYTTHKNQLKIDYKDCKIRPENIGDKLLDPGSNFFFFNLTPKAKATQAKIHIKLKSFCIAKESINRMKRQPTEWEKIFANHISKNIFKNSYNSVTKIPPQNLI